MTVNDMSRRNQEAMVLLGHLRSGIETLEKMLEQLLKTKFKQTLLRIQMLSDAYKSQIENERKTGIQMVTHIDLCL